MSILKKTTQSTLFSDYRPFAQFFNKNVLFYFVPASVPHFPHHFQLKISSRNIGKICLVDIFHEFESRDEGKGKRLILSEESTLVGYMYILDYPLQHP